MKILENQTVMLQRLIQINENNSAAMNSSFLSCLLQLANKKKNPKKRKNAETKFEDHKFEDHKIEEFDFNSLLRSPASSNPPLFPNTNSDLLTLKFEEFLEVWRKENPSTRSSTLFHLSSKICSKQEIEEISGSISNLPTFQNNDFLENFNFEDFNCN